MHRLGSMQKPSSPNAALRRELDRALAALAGDPPLRDVSVHDARKALKRARAALRVLRDAIGDAAYHRANRRLRDAARPLARVRDAAMAVATVDALRASAKQPERRAELASLEHELRAEQKRTRSEVLGAPATLRDARRAIASVRSQSRRWRAGSAGALRGAVKRIYREGRKASARAQHDERDETLHESRKQAKYLAKALKILAPDDNGALAKRAQAISDALGKDHDLAMLTHKLVAPDRAAPPSRALLARIGRRRAKLQRKAAKRSRRLFRPKAKAFADEIVVRAG
jgi:hypothetical protein